MRSQNSVFVFGLAAAACVYLAIGPLQGQEIAQPAGSLPVLREVDVVVVGGGSGGVAAALEAAGKGAKVFVAAPRPYLGEDICATSRLWLEPGETPETELAKEVYRSPERPAAPGIGMPFTYSASVPSVRHRDTEPGSLLTDGKWESASQQSVQWDSEVSLSLDLGAEKEVRKVHLLAYQRPGDFEVGSFAVSSSNDRAQWSPVSVVENELAGQGGFEETALVISGETPAKARYLKLDLKLGEGRKRLLIGEVIVEGPPSSAPVPQTGAGAIRMTTPMQVKRSLDQALIKAGVPFLYWTYTTDLLRDAQGKPAGVVVCGRSGRQAVLAKVIIDATERASIARLAGASFTEYVPGTQAFSRVVVGGPPREGKGMQLRPRSTPLTITDRKGTVFPVHEYQFELQMPGSSFSAFAEAEQTARDLTWTAEAVDGAETLFQVPPDHCRGRATLAGAWPGAGEVPVACFEPKDCERIYVLGGCADLSREAAEALVRPLNLMSVGARIGQAAAGQAASLPKLEGVRLAARAPQQPLPGTARDVVIEGDPRAGERTIPEDVRALPVLGDYDVVVVGGGTGGAPAAIGAGRQGARTLLLEYLHGLGGVGTLGYISTYYHGNRVGFTTEMDQAVAAMGQENLRPGTWNPEHKSEWYRQELRKAGVDIWFGSMGSGAVVENGKVTGVIALTPQGRGVIRAKVVIDATGNADIAAAAGALCRYVDESDLAVQGTGLPPRELGQKYTNTDYTFVDDNDPVDIWRALVTAKLKFSKAYDLGQLIDTRERRQIVGDITLTPLDMYLQRSYPDTVVLSRSNFDSHGYVIHPMFMIRPPHRADVDVRVPWRCLLPRGLDGIIVTGLGVSAHRDAIPCIRMQPDIQNQGYACGVAASMIVRKGCTTREVDLRALQKHLIGVGNLPESVLTETDNLPLPKEQVAAAVLQTGKDYEGLEVVLAHWETSQPLLRDAYAKATGPERLNFAHILGMMGDATGAETLAQIVSSTPWDEGWKYRSGGQFGASLSPLDSYIIALGRTKAPAALAPVLEKLSQINPESPEFSHFRAVAIALETLGAREAAKPLAELLRKPGLGGHAATHIEMALADNPRAGSDTSVRSKALTEIYLARALYRCGDFEKLGEQTLRQYSQDLHGHYARHALAVLKAGPEHKSKAQP